MSLASDIIRKAGVNLAPPVPRKANRNFLELSEERTAGKPKHARKYHNKWAAIVWRGNHRYHLGMHDTGERAEIASRLFLHWCKTHPPADVPRKPETELPYATIVRSPVPSELLSSFLEGQLELTNGQIESVVEELLRLRK